MKKDGGEPRRFPATKRALRRARREGAYPQTPVLIVAVSFTATVLYLWFAWAQILLDCNRLFQFAASMIMFSFTEAYPKMIYEVLRFVGTVILPPFLIAGLSSVLASVIGSQGIVFSFKPLSPDISRLNPINGVQRIFSLRSVVETVVDFLKVIIFLCIGIFIFTISANTLSRMVFVDFDAVPSVFGHYFGLLVLAAAIVMLLAAIVDWRLQQWLFARDMRMTRSEIDRDRREEQGDRHIKDRRQQRAREQLQAAGSIGPGASTLVLIGPNIAVGLRFVRGETSAPILSFKAYGEDVTAKCAIARKAGAIEAQNLELATALINHGNVGEYVPPVYFEQVIPYIIGSKS